jgi:hypothetical protein
MMNYLYVFVDVSGNYDFSPTGTKYIVLTSIICTDICSGILELYKLKHHMIDKGIYIEYFHAAEDRQAVRDDVFNIIAELMNLRIDSVIVEKRKTAPKIRPLKIFYPKMIEYLLNYPFNPQGVNVSSFDKVFIFIDREGSKGSERDALIKAIKMSLARHLGKVTYVICMHSSLSHYYLQIVDYCSWAIYVKHEKGEYRPYNKIRHLVKSEFPIFEDGNIDWY